MCGVGRDANLPTSITARIHTDPLQRHRQQADRDLFTGRDHDIELTGIRIRAHLARQSNQTIGLTAHGRHHHDNLITPSPERRDPFGYVCDTFRRAD